MEAILTPSPTGERLAQPLPQGSSQGSEGPSHAPLEAASGALQGAPPAQISSGLDSGPSGDVQTAMVQIEGRVESVLQGLQLGQLRLHEQQSRGEGEAAAGNVAIAAVREAVVAVDGRLGRVEGVLARIEAQPSGSDDVALGDRLDRIEALLRDSRHGHGRPSQEGSIVFPPWIPPPPSLPSPSTEATLEPLLPPEAPLRMEQIATPPMEARHAPPTALPPPAEIELQESAPPSGNGSPSELIQEAWL